MASTLPAHRAPLDRASLAQTSAARLERPVPGPALSIAGWVYRPLQVRAADLDAMAWLNVSDFEVVCTRDGSHGRLPPVRAVRLCELIDRARPVFLHRTDFKRVAIVAEGRDGYRALFSWGELFNCAAAGSVLVAYDAPDSRLPPNARPFALLPCNDAATGPRYVRALRSVDVHKLW